jgi:hypothetical protein
MLRQWYLGFLATLGMPVSQRKMQGPSDSVVWLGFRHTLSRRVHELPPAKLMLVLREVQGSTLQAGQAVPPGFESLVGKLSHVCGIMLPGRPMMRDLYRAVHTGVVSSATQSSLRWWNRVLPRMEYFCSMRRPNQPSDPRVVTDASLWGGGFAVKHSKNEVYSHGFFFQWPHKLAGSLCSGDMTFLEAVCLLEAVQHVVDSLEFGPRVRGGMLVVECDNQSVLAAVIAGRGRNLGLHLVVAALFDLLFVHDIQLHCVHVPSVQNPADYLSRVPAPVHKRPAPPAQAWQSVAQTPAPGPTHWLLSLLGAYRRRTDAEPQSCAGGLKHLPL